MLITNKTLGHYFSRCFNSWLSILQENVLIQSYVKKVDLFGNEKKWIVANFQLLP